MDKYLAIVALCLAASTSACPLHQKSQKLLYDYIFLIYYPFNFVRRDQWGANPPLSTTALHTPAPYVVIHHSYEPGVCMTKDQCKQYMRSMQNFHQNGNGWADIGYNFAVGGEGSVYEGRGWHTVGAHAGSVNARSIGIVVIGDYVSELPTQKALETVQNMISTGVKLGFISPEYKLIGHRQVSSTECPGTALFNEIQKWDRFSPTL